MTPEHRQLFHEQGYLVLRQILPSETVRKLSEIIRSMISDARRGKTRIKWADAEQTIPKSHVRGFLDPHSKYKSHDPYFVEWLETDIVPRVEFLLDGKVTCTKLSMLFAGQDSDPSPGWGWHRDGGGRSKGPYTVEALALDVGRSCCFQTPLKPHDNCHRLLPASHDRPLLDHEERIRSERKSPMPGMVRITLQPGDVLFRHAKILHGGSNSDGRERWTFVGNFWKKNVRMAERT